MTSITTTVTQGYCAESTPDETLPVAEKFKLPDQAAE